MNYHNTYIYIYIYIHTHTHTHTHTHIHIISHSFCGWGNQEQLSWVTLTQGLSPEVEVTGWPHQQLTECLTKEGVSTPQGAHSNGWQVGAGCWQEVSVLFLLGSPECPYGMIASFSQRKYPRHQDRAEMPFCDLTSGVIWDLTSHYHLCHILLVTWASQVVQC